MAHDPEKDLCAGPQLGSPHHCPHHQSGCAALYGVSQHFREQGLSGLPFILLYVKYVIYVVILLKWIPFVFLGGLESKYSFL